MTVRKKTGEPGGVSPRLARTGRPIGKPLGARYPGANATRLASFLHIRRGHSLLELVAATTIIALALVPALRMMSDSLRVGRETETSNLMATLAASRLEEYLLLSAGQWGAIPAGGSWNTTTDTGSYAAEGYPNLKFSVVRTDSAPEGISTRLLSITATVWNDLDNDNVWDAGEPRSQFASKLARNVAYSNEAAGP